MYSSGGQIRKVLLLPPAGRSAPMLNQLDAQPSLTTLLFSLPTNGVLPTVRQSARKDLLFSLPTNGVLPTVRQSARKCLLQGGTPITVYHTCFDVCEALPSLFCLTETLQLLETAYQPPLLL